MYSTPKVTIDLEEYQELVKEKRESIPSDVELVAAKMMICSLLRNRMDLRLVEQDMANAGLAFDLNLQPTRHMLPDDIHFKKINT